MQKQINPTEKICTECLEVKPKEAFEKHRNKCRECRKAYKRNRYHDLKDGKRDDANWYTQDEEMTNARIIEDLNKKLKTKPKMMTSFNDPAQESRFIAYTFILAYAFIIYICIKAVYDVSF